MKIMILDDNHLNIYRKDGRAFRLTMLVGGGFMVEEEQGGMLMSNAVAERLEKKLKSI